MKNSLLFFISISGLLLCLGSCTTYQAVPHDGQMLKLADKGDIKANGSIAFNRDVYSRNFSAQESVWSKEGALTVGYSPIQGLGLSGRLNYGNLNYYEEVAPFSFPVPTSTPQSHQTNFLGEIAIGGYKNLTFENWKGRFLFDTYAGLGVGHSRNLNSSGGGVNLTYFNMSLQPNMHFYPADFVSISIGLRYEGRIHQKGHVTNIAPGDPEWPTTQLTYEPHNTFMRILRIDFHAPFGNIYIGNTTNYGGLYTGYFAGLGLNIDYFQKKKKRDAHPTH